MGGRVDAERTFEMGAGAVEVTKLPQHAAEVVGVAGDAGTVGP
jgi:hypothetical protein